MYRKYIIYIIQLNITILNGRKEEAFIETSSGTDGDIYSNYEELLIIGSSHHHISYYLKILLILWLGYIMYDFSFLKIL